MNTDSGAYKELLELKAGTHNLIGGFVDCPETMGYLRVAEYYLAKARNCFEEKEQTQH